MEQPTYYKQWRFRLTRRIRFVISRNWVCGRTYVYGIKVFVRHNDDNGELVRLNPELMK